MEGMRELFVHQQPTCGGAAVVQVEGELFMWERHNLIFVMDEEY